MQQQEIHTYNRAQAIADGFLVDVSRTAREAGITYPVAISANLCADIADIPAAHSCQSFEGRLWDVLWMLRQSILGRVPYTGSDNLRTYRLIMHVGRAKYYAVQASCGPGDNDEPVITLMCPDED